jgi:hypothetical protein
MRSGDRPGLQNRRAAGNPIAGGFDPHSLPPFVFIDLAGGEIQSQGETCNRLEAVRDEILIAQRITMSLNNQAFFALRRGGKKINQIVINHP